MLRVLLCDDAVAYSNLFAHWMSVCEGVEVIGQTNSPDEVRDLAREQRPDVIVLDHMMRSATSDSLVPALREAAPGSRILLISNMTAEDLEKAAALSRPDGFISKASRPEEMCDAVRRVAGLPSCH